MKKLICKIFGHDYYLKKRLNSYSRCVGCKRCDRFFGMNDDVRALIAWDIELTELYNYSPYL